MAYISFKNVEKIYHVGEIDIHALAGVDFEIEKGEFVVIAGASGAGKSTILNILGGMDTCTSGEIVVDGARVDKMNDAELTNYRRYDIGFVFQFYNLVQNLTALENVELATEITRNPLKASDVLRDVGLKDRMNNFPSQLSGGEQQRVAIARALAKNPKVMFCDEPTGALDEKTGKKVLEALVDVNKRYGPTLIIVTHNPGIALIGDRVIKMNSGKIIEQIKNEKRIPPKDIPWG